MRVAIMFSGQPRNVEQGSKYILPNIIEANRARGHELDIFGFVWYSSDVTGAPFINAGGHVASSPVPEDTPALIYKLYSPTEITFCKQLDFSEAARDIAKIMDIVPAYSLSQRFAERQVFDIATRNRSEIPVPYDAYLRIRFDFAIQTPLLFDELPLDKLTLINDCPHAGGVNDIIAFGNMRSMSVRSSLYFNMKKYHLVDGLPFLDEVLLGHHLRSVPLNLINIPYSLLRN